MLNHILSSRVVLTAFVFCMLIVSGSLFYSWHIRRTTDAELALSDALLQHRKNQNETRTTTDTIDTSRVNFEQTEGPLKTENTQTIVDDTAALPSEDVVLIDLSDAFLPDDSVSVEEPLEDVLVSPFGFGPYPEVPVGYRDPNLWDHAEAIYELSPDRARDWELRERVCIKLWQQGKHSESVVMEDGLVYPCYPNTVYVRWGSDIAENGSTVTYIEELIAPGSLSRYADDFDNDIIPSGITIIPYDGGGIDPYAFLNLY